MKFTAEQIAEVLSGKVEGDEQAIVSQLSKIEEGGKESLTFLSNPKYEAFLYKSKATVCIVNEDFELKEDIPTTLIRVKNASEAFTGLLEYYDQLKEEPEGLEEPHVMHENVNYGEGFYLGAFAYISKGVSIGKNVKIHPQCFIGKNTTIGDNVNIHSGVKILEGSVIGNNCLIHSNVVIGSDGFGFQRNQGIGIYKKVPQIGNVVVEDNVEIGACTTIDRATMGSTIIREGVKLDNQIQIAHNVEVGGNTVIAAQTGVAGSTKIGQNNIFGGQVGVAGHLQIGNNIQVQAQSGIGRNLKDGSAVQGSPAIDYNSYSKSYVYFKNLPEHIKKLHSIEKKLENNGGEEK
jgi:UDP-3-O-[3-hydroxymyristoyl] glucosamine N-acyltransferase